MCHYDDQTNIAKQLHAKMKENVRRPADGHAGVAGAQRANTSEDDDDRRRAKGGEWRASCSHCHRRPFPSGTAL